VKRFNFSLLVVGLIAGLLVGVFTAHPITWISIGIVAGIALAISIRPKKKSCCQ
jgi:predicted benzoate:H+ symporter BenE